MLYFRYGKYSHQVGEVDIARQRDILRDAAGSIIGRMHRWMIRGTLMADGVASIDLAVQNLLGAYNTPVAYCGMYDTELGPIKSFWLQSNQCIGGIKVMSGPTFPTGAETQHVTQLDYTITLEATVPYVSDGVRDFQEQLAFSGGGPIYTHLEPLYGLPVKVLAKQNTVYRASQRGRSTGWLSYPAAPPPVWPSALVRAPQVNLINPRMDNGTLVDWTIEWDYVFESAFPLLGTPHHL